MSQIPSYAEQRDRLQAEIAKQAPAEALEKYAEAAARVAALDFAARAPQVGQNAPAFSLPNQHGETISLDLLRAGGPVVVIFYRGAWCPFCNLQLRSFQEALPELAARGAALVAISPQHPDGSLSMADKHDLGFDVLSDLDGQTIRAWGLDYQVDDSLRAMQEASGLDLEAVNATGAWELPAAATFVIRLNGKVAFAEINGDWSQRTEPARVVEVLDDIKGSGAVGGHRLGARD